jgi:hypothetical protein
MMDSALVDVEGGPAAPGTPLELANLDVESFLRDLWGRFHWRMQLNRALSVLEQLEVLN